MVNETTIAAFIAEAKKITGIKTVLRGVFVPLNFGAPDCPLVFISEARETIQPGQNPLDKTPQEELQLSIYLTTFDKGSDFEKATASIRAYKKEVYKKIVSVFPFVNEIIIDNETPYQHLGDLMNGANTAPYYSVRFDLTIRGKGKI